MPSGALDIARTSRPDPVEAELAAWKAARRRMVPWRQIYLMATLCFGAASFVLSDSVNTLLDGLLAILSLMSFVAWWRGRAAQG